MTELTVRRRRRRPVLTDAQIAALPRKPAAYFHPDPELPRHGVRVHPSDRPGTYTVIARDIYKRQKWVKIGSTAEMTIAEARELAGKVIRRIEAGLAPFEPAPPEPASVQAVVEAWLVRHVEKHRLRTAREMRRIVEKYILPHWAKRDFVTIRRTDIVGLLDHVEDHHGASTAEAALKIVRSIMHWYRDERDEHYVPPTFTKNMRRIPVQDRARSRVLADGELRAVWRAAEDGGAFGALVRLLLLSAQRREKWLTARHDDIDMGTGIWTISRQPREKGAPERLALPQVAVDIIKLLPRFAGNERIFHQVPNLARAKAAFDKACGVTGWRLHDLRRTARTLMSRAGVRPDVAERCLGHVVGGVEPIYDKHSYGPEMAEALRRLAALLAAIIDPPAGDNILRMPTLAIVPS